MTPVARYFCPLDCGWHHDQAAPDFTDPDRLYPIADIPEGVDQIAFQAAAGALRTVDAIVKRHLETHGLLDWSQAITRIKAERDQLAELAKARHRVINRLAREAQTAEAAVERARDWLGKWGPQLPDGACSTLDRALNGPPDRSTAAAIDETYCYEPPNCQCGHGAEYHGPEAGCIECRCPLTLAKALQADDGRTTPDNPPASSDTADNPAVGYADTEDRNPDGTCPDWCPCHRLKEQL